MKNNRNRHLVISKNVPTAFLFPTVFPRDQFARLGSFSTSGQFDFFETKARSLFENLQLRKTFEKYRTLFYQMTKITCSRPFTRVDPGHDLPTRPGVLWVRVAFGRFHSGQ